MFEVDEGLWTAPYTAACGQHQQAQGCMLEGKQAKHMLQ